MRHEKEPSRLMSLSLSNPLLEGQWYAFLVLQVYIVHMFRWLSGLKGMACPWDGFTAVSSGASSQLSVRLKTCHHFLCDQHKWHECWWNHIIIMSMGAKWAWTITFPACYVAQWDKWVDGVVLIFIPDCVIGVIVIISPNLLDSLSSSLKMNP